MTHSWRILVACMLVSHVSVINGSTRSIKATLVLNFIRFSQFISILSCKMTDSYRFFVVCMLVTYMSVIKVYGSHQQFSTFYPSLFMFISCKTADWCRYAAAMYDVCCVLEYCHWFLDVYRAISDFIFRLFSAF